MSDAPHWQPLALLDRQLRLNLTSLVLRYPDLAAQLDLLTPAHEYLLSTRDTQLSLAQRSPDGRIDVLRNPLPASTAAIVASKLYPTGRCTQPMLVAGLDQGWLWRTLYEMEVSTPHAPGHRPPLYFLCGTVERLWVVLHLHDWRNLLGDGRVQLFCGADAVERLGHYSIANPHIPFPRLSITVDPSLWPAGVNIDAMFQHLHRTLGSRLDQTLSRLQTTYADFDAAALAARLRAGTPIRVLGITSRFTTFLQYSMRDWLTSMESLGHTTRLLIEDADHESNCPNTVASACEEFQPDLILMIDHYRAELRGLPAGVPFVMWVQDRLPNIFATKAGAAQRDRDYVIGQGRVECVHQYGYPSARFMPAMIGTNQTRFAPHALSADESAAYACDVSFVSHCSTPAEVILRIEIERQNSLHAKKLLESVFEQLLAIYDAGGSVTAQYRIETIVRNTMQSTQTNSDDPRPLFDFFTHKINNALFRHQSLRWLAEMDVDLRLYGRGWDQHPRFGRFARGIANNEHQLAILHRASRINLQITPFGAAHQRLFDGLAAGGFFLLRGVPGDRFDQLLRLLWQRCQTTGIRNNADLEARADTEIRAWLAEMTEIEGRSLLGRGYDFISELAVTAAEGFTRSAGTLWREYDRVAYITRSQLQAQVQHFLTHPEEREALTASMRQRVIDSLTYTAISGRTLHFIADDLTGATTGISLRAPKTAA